MARVRAGVVYQKWHDLLGLLSLISIKLKSLSTPARLKKILKKFLEEVSEINMNVEIL